jgi:succinate dehydrogenase / fumarate reductase flavoprotein subunit
MLPLETPKWFAMRVAALVKLGSASISISALPFNVSAGTQSNTIEERYGNLFEMYNRITGEDPYVVPMRIYPAIHYTMGGLWVDYELMTTIPGLFALGEANFSDHGANRLGASALMQGLSDGYFISPYTVGNYLAGNKVDKVDTSHPEFKAVEAQVSGNIQKLLSINGKRTVNAFHKELGKIMWEYCGMSRTEGGLKTAINEIRVLREEFWSNVRVGGGADEVNASIESAGRVADYFELGELMCIDALERNESCGGHFREEYQTPEGEAQRNDEQYSYTAAWEFNGVGNAPILNKELLEFHYVHPSQRSYK